MIQESSMIVSLSISRWSARKHDKKITDEVRDQHNASSDAGRYNKLLASKEQMEAVQKTASAARQYYYDNTVPWGDNNERLLKADFYFTFVSEMQRLKSEDEQAVQKFLANYDYVIQDAKVRLNGMFNERDYPSRTEIADKFSFKLTFMPVPDTDFRVKLSDEQVESLRQSVTSEVNTRLANAVADTWKRIKDQLQAMRERLRTKDAIFRDSLFGNLKELIELLPNLNVTDDPNLNLACKEMGSILADPDAVRSNPDLRQIKADEVDKVLNQFSQFFPS